MDRIARNIDHVGDDQPVADGAVLRLPDREELLIERSAQRASLPESLFSLNELEVLYHADTRALWTFMRPQGRPSFTPPMLGDFELWQHLIASHFGPRAVPLDYLVLGSRAPGVFCFGGDLELFQRLIREGNRDGLRAYGHRCVGILHRNIHALDLPMITIGLVQGKALGGGFEALLSFDFIVAERGATFGLPEIVFGLFPGMGAHTILSRKVGTAMAERMILSNQTYTAEELHGLGIVCELAEPGEGVAAVQEFIRKSARKHAGLVGSRRAMRSAAPIALEELRTIVDHWANAALQLSESDLKLMSRLASAQVRLVKAS